LNRPLTTLILIASAGLFSPGLRAFNVGFNQAWWNNSYSSQWIDGSYPPSEVRRVLDLTKNAGSRTLRVWLFEGQDPQSLLWKDGKVSGLHPDFLKNFEDFIIAARERGIQIYPTLFDGNILRTLQKGPFRDRWWNLLNNKYGARQAFEKKALEPLVKLLSREDIRPSVFGLDIMNEIDAAVSGAEFDKDWASANELVCALRGVVRAKRGRSSAVPVTASIGWPMIPFYSRGAANLILDPNPHPSCVDYWDIHFYNNEGSIPNCEKIAKVSRDYKKKIYLGEFGQLSKAYSDDLQVKTVTNFIRNAKACGFAGALAWRLADNRAGNNPEARLSFEAFGKMRPAYDVIRNWNHSAQGR
jgi:hypothetical protein